MQTTKKRVHVGLLIALSLTFSLPTQAETLKEGAIKSYNNAYKKIKKQWKKIKPCITKAQCSKKQLASFVGAALVVAGLVYKEHRKSITKYPGGAERAWYVANIRNYQVSNVKLRRKLFNALHYQEASTVKALIQSIFSKLISLSQPTKDDINSKLSALSELAPAIQLFFRVLANINPNELSTVNKELKRRNLPLL